MRDKHNVHPVNDIGNMSIILTFFIKTLVTSAHLGLELDLLNH